MPSPSFSRIHRVAEARLFSGVSPWRNEGRTRRTPRRRSGARSRLADARWKTGCGKNQMEKAGDRRGGRQLGSGLWALGSGLWALGSGLWALGSGLWALGSGLWALGSGLWALGSGLWALGSGLHCINGNHCDCQDRAAIHDAGTHDHIAVRFSPVVSTVLRFVFNILILFVGCASRSQPLHVSRWTLVQTLAKGKPVSPRRNRHRRRSTLGRRYR